MSRSDAWSRLNSVVARIAAADDEGLEAAVVAAFAELLGLPVRLDSVEPYRGMAFELADGGELFGHVVADPAPLAEKELRPVGEVLAHFAAARLECARLRRESAKFRAVVDSADIALTVADTRRHTVYANAGLEQLSGFSIDEINSIPAEQRIFAADLAAVEAARAENLQGRPTRIRWRLIHKEGRTVWVESFARPVVDAAGNIELIVLSSRDVTAEVEATERLRRADERHRIIASLAPAVPFDAVLADDNMVTVEWLGGPAEANNHRGFLSTLHGNGWMSLLHPADLPGIPAVLAQLRTGQQTVWEHRYASADRGFVWRRTVARAVSDPGLPQGYLRIYGSSSERPDLGGDETFGDEQLTHAE